MSTDSVVFWLIAMTLLVGIAIGAWQLFRVRNSQHKRGEVPGVAGTERAKQGTGVPR
jgi:hypothetical protein